MLVSKALRIQQLAACQDVRISRQHGEVLCEKLAGHTELVRDDEMDEATMANRIEVMRRVLLERRTKNSKYSLRAYARDLAIDSSTLAQILHGKRGLPMGRVKDVAERLRLSADESQLFMGHEVVLATADYSSARCPSGDQCPP